MTSKEEAAKIKAELSKDPLERIRQLEALQIATEEKADKREEELLIELTSQQEKNADSRKTARDALKAAKVAEFKYINQQKDQITGVSHLLDPNETDPERKSRFIFVDQLKARCEKSQTLADERKIRQDGNLFFI